MNRFHGGIFSFTGRTWSMKGCLTFSEHLINGSVLSDDEIEIGDGKLGSIYLLTEGGRVVGVFLSLNQYFQSLWKPCSG